MLAALPPTSRKSVPAAGVTTVPLEVNSSSTPAMRRAPSCGAAAFMEAPSSGTIDSVTLVWLAAESTAWSSLTICCCQTAGEVPALSWYRLALERPTCVPSGTKLTVSDEGLVRSSNRSSRGRIDRFMGSPPL